MKNCPTCFQDIPEGPRGFGSISVDREKRIAINGKVITHLSPKATTILYRLVSRKGAIVSTDSLADVFGENTNYLDCIRVTIAKLRKIVSPMQIYYSAGEGYYLSDPEAAVHRVFDKRWKDVHE